jgi:hypothetical protein
LRYNVISFRNVGKMGRARARLHGGFVKWSPR